MQFQPSRLGYENISQQLWYDKFSTLVADGMRVQLATGNLLTGTLIVKLVSKPELGEGVIDFSAEPYPQLPAIESNVEAVTADVETLVKNLSELPLDSLVTEATQLLSDTRQLIASPDVAALPAQLSESMASLADASSDLPAMVQSLILASNNANNVLEGLSPDSEIYIELSTAARELSTAARSIAKFAELLEENPSAVLTGR
jgi:paraquat-inducible protein B